MPRTINETDKFVDRMLKHIPSEIIGAYLAVSGMLSSLQGSLLTTMNWINFGLFLIATPFWLIYVSGVTTVWQNVLSLIAFVFWVMTLVGGPFSFVPPVIGSAGVLFFSALLAPVVAGIASRGTQPVPAGARAVRG
jgi:hypothetical protein